MDCLRKNKTSNFGIWMQYEKFKMSLIKLQFSEEKKRHSASYLSYIIKNIFDMSHLAYNNVFQES